MMWEGPSVPAAYEGFCLSPLFTWRRKPLMLAHWLKWSLKFVMSRSIQAHHFLFGRSSDVQWQYWESWMACLSESTLESIPRWNYGFQLYCGYTEVNRKPRTVSFPSRLKNKRSQEAPSVLQCLTGLFDLFHIALSFNKTTYIIWLADMFTVLM